MAGVKNEYQKEKTPIVYRQLSAELLRDERIRIFGEQLKDKCCSFCGHELEIRVAEKMGSNIVELGSYCPRCNQPNCGLEKEVYINSLTVLVNTMRLIQLTQE